MRLLLAAFAEKSCEEGAALFGEEVGGDFDFVVELGVVHNGEDAAAGSRLGVVGGVDKAGDARMEDGSGTHGAGFERDVEGAVCEAVVAKMKAGLAEGDDLGVGGGVTVSEDAVLAATDDLVSVDDDGAYGNLAVGFGVIGFCDCFAELGFVVFVRRGHRRLV